VQVLFRLKEGPAAMVAALIADGFRNYLRADTENRRRSCRHHLHSELGTQAGVTKICDGE